MSFGKFFEISILFLFIIIAGSFNAQAASVPLNISFNVNSGQTFDVAVTVDPLGTAIAGVQMNIAFNKSTIIVNNIMEGDLLKKNGASTFFNSGVINNMSGTVQNIYGAIVGQNSVSTPGTFIIINATAIGTSGTYWINLSNLKISDPNGVSVPINGPTPTPSPDGSSSGGGGGGGGTSGENFSNIEKKEKHDLYIYKDKVTSYVFSDSGNPIQFINITGNSSPGEINAAVEVLKNTSSLVKTPAPGMVYRNVNIWVGTSGFAVPKNIKYAVIRFKVENSWISISGLSSSDIKMLSWDGREWLQLETAEKTSDSKYTYYEVNTDHFSSFAISGIKGVRTASPVVSLPSSPEGIAAVTPAAKASGFEFFFAIIAIFSICRRKRR